MKFLRFTIQNYRAIENATIEINHNRLIPIIGINESGKTSALLAILAFNRQKDDFLAGTETKGDHILNFENNYYLGKKKQISIIKAEVLLEKKSEIDDIATKLDLPRGGEVEQQMLNHITTDATIKVPIIICRELSSDSENHLVTRYYVENTPIDPSLNEKYAEALYEHTPNIVYFKTFENQIDEVISVPKGYLDGKDTSSRKEWRDLLQEIFKSASKKTIGDEYSIKDFLELETNGDTQGSVLRAINMQLNEDIMDEWKRLSKDGQALTEENLSDLSLEIRYIPNNEETPPEFKIKVIDKTPGQAGKEFSINNRSTGLRWFFNFIIKLKYNFDYKNSGALFLLDEPGSNLHSTAQQGLLNKLSQLSEQSPIVFGTHSEDLLDPDIINVASIKIAKRNGHKVEIKSFSKAGYKLNEGAWTPLQRALHLKTGFTNLSDPRIIITEGITDYYFFKMIQEHTDLINKTVKFIPGAGAFQLTELISISIASSEKYLVLLDSDRAGRDAYVRYEKFFGKDEAQNFFKYKTPLLDKDILLESFLSDEDKNKLVTLIGFERPDEGQNAILKSAIVALYHCGDPNKIKSFIEELNEQTLLNMSIVLVRVNTLKQDTEQEIKYA